MLARRKPIPSNIERAPRREFPKHRQWVRGHVCAVPDCPARKIQFAHARNGTDGGTGLKPSDWWGLPLCGPGIIDGQMTEGHHAEQHRIGEESFEAKHGIDMKKIAQALARRSPDLAMKEAMKETA